MPIPARPRWQPPSRAEPLVDPRELIPAAELLVGRVRLGDGWLRDQVIGVRSYAAGLAALVGLVLRRGRGLRPRPADPNRRTRVRRCPQAACLRRCYQGDQPLVERYPALAGLDLGARGAGRQRTVAAVIEAARAWTRASQYRVAATAKRCSGERSCATGLGSRSANPSPHLRSRIAVNVDLPLSAVELLRLAIHETYPGHHTERAWKDHLLVRGRRKPRETLVLVPIPPVTRLRGDRRACARPPVLLEGDGGAALAAVMREAGIGLDLDHALAVERALEPCRWAEVNAALMLHETGSSEAEVHAYLRRWGLMTPKLAAHLLTASCKSRPRGLTRSPTQQGESSAAPRPCSLHPVPLPAYRAGAHPEILAAVPDHGQATVRSYR